MNEWTVEKMTNDSLVRNVKLLVQMHAEGLLGGEIMPEDVLQEIVPKEELPDVLTLGMTLNYQRNSYALWKSIAEAYHDHQSRWIFHPHAVSKSSHVELRHVLLHYRIALQPTRHPEIWHRVSKGITESSHKRDVMGLFDSVQFDVAALKNIIQMNRKSDFPYLSGPKIFNYWLYVM